MHASHPGSGSVCCSVLACVAVRCGLLQCYVQCHSCIRHLHTSLPKSCSGCCRVLQCVAVCCSLLQLHWALTCLAPRICLCVLQSVEVFCRVCSMVHRVAECCSVLQWKAIILASKFQTYMLYQYCYISYMCVCVRVFLYMLNTYTCGTSRIRVCSIEIECWAISWQPIIYCGEGRERKSKHARERASERLSKRKRARQC